MPKQNGEVGGEVRGGAWFANSGKVWRLIELAGAIIVMRLSARKLPPPLASMLDYGFSLEVSHCVSFGFKGMTSPKITTYGTLERLYNLFGKF